MKKHVSHFDIYLKQKKYFFNFLNSFLAYFYTLPYFHPPNY